MNYYNEFEPKAASALRQLIADGLIPYGDVDERSIVDVRPKELKGYTQCHFFAGIGGWSYALELAGWPADRPVWTGSCPCQPFSSAGKQKGRADERHLWPVWFRLIRECRPPVIFGEQVASAIAHGWLDEVADDLESEGYAFGSAIVPACSVGAPHKRDRLWFVGNTEHDGSHGGSVNRGNATSISNNAQGQEQSTMANTSDTRSQGHREFGNEPIQEGREREERHPWQSGVFIDCPDGKQRIIEPTIRLLANGFPERVGLLRAGGNAIVPQVAAQFIKAYQEG